VRSLLLPSVLALLGRRTWALPRLLERRLPHIAIDAARPPTRPAASVPAIAEEG
jgi:putative drug exporter of the RND superfamily